MACSYGVVYPLWSFADDRGAALERIIDETGIDHVSIPLVTGPIREFRAEPIAPPHYFHSSGGWHYEFDRKRYESLALKPVAGGWVGKRHVLKEMLDFAARRGIAVGFEFDFRSAIEEISDFSRAARRTIHDEPTPTDPCRLHPDVQELIERTIVEVRAHEPRFVTLEYWPLREFENELFDAMQRCDVELAPLVAQCFCAGCRAAAVRSDRALELSVGIESLRTIFAQFMRNEPVDVSSRASLIRFLEQYRVLRNDARSSADQLVLGLLGRTEARLSESSITALIEGTCESHKITPRAGLWNYSSERSADRQLEELRSADARHWAFSICVADPIPDASDKLVSLVSRLAEFSPVSIDFAGVDCAPRRVVGWIKQAMRFARRSESL